MYPRILVATCSSIRVFPTSFSVDIHFTSTRAYILPFETCFSLTLDFMLEWKWWFVFCRASQQGSWSKEAGQFEITIYPVLVVSTLI
jgi:hypothetical protein